jgi:hypothetical protein
VTLRALAAVILVALACGARPQPAPSTAPAGASSATAGSADLVFVVPRDGAIVEVDGEGRLLRTIAAVPADELWRLPGGAFLAYTYKDSTLRRVRAGGQVDLTIALPARGLCDGNDFEHGLFPQFGISVDRDRHAASATMAELEFDASFNVAVTVCLDTGRVYADPESMMEDCKVEPAPELGAPPCLANASSSSASETSEPGGEPPPDPHRRQYGFDVQDANVLRREGDRVTVVGGPLLAYDGTTVRSISPSGRWLLLQGPELTASSVYHYWLLFDRRTGDVYPLPGALPREAPARWPAPMGPAAFAAPGEELRSLSYTARPFRWYPGSEDLFQVESLLIRPGERVVDLGGRPAHDD